MNFWIRRKYIDKNYYSEFDLVLVLVEYDEGFIYRHLQLAIETVKKQYKRMTMSASVSEFGGGEAKCHF